MIIIEIAVVQPETKVVSGTTKSKKSFRLRHSTFYANVRNSIKVRTYTSVSTHTDALVYL